MEAFEIHPIIRSRSVRRVSNGIFVFLLLVFVQVCLMLLMPDSTLDLLLVLVFSFSLKHVQFLEEELFLSHLHMLSHICFCPGGLCWLFPPHIIIIICFAAVSAPSFDSCGSAVFACGCCKAFPVPTDLLHAVLCWGSFMGASDQWCTMGAIRAKGFDTSTLLKLVS